MASKEDGVSNRYITSAAGHSSQALLPQPIPKKTVLKGLLLSDISLMKEILREFVTNNPEYVSEILNETYKANAEQIYFRTLNQEAPKKTSSLPEHSLPRQNEQDEFKKNVEEYKKMEEDLIKNPSYAGMFVALYKQKVVAKGYDKVKLLQDVYREYGYVPVLVHKVGEKRVVHYRSPRSTA